MTIATVLHITNAAPSATPSPSSTPTTARSFFITSLAPSYAPTVCMTVFSNLTTDDTPLVLWNCHCKFTPCPRGTHQFFKIQVLPAAAKAPGAYSLEPLSAPGKCVSLHPSANITLSGCDYSASQRWRFHLVNSGVWGWMLQSWTTGMAMYVPGGSKVLNTRIAATSFEVKPGTLFVTVAPNIISFPRQPTIVASVSPPFVPNLLWDVRGMLTRNNTPLILWPPKLYSQISLNQKFALRRELSASASYVMRPFHAPTTCLTTVPVPGYTIGPVVIRPCVREPFQRWHLLLAFFDTWGLSFVQEGLSSAITVPYASSTTTTKNTALVTNTLGVKLGQVFSITYTTF